MYIYIYVYIVYICPPCLSSLREVLESPSVRTTPSGMFSYVTTATSPLALRSENVAWIGVETFECKSCSRLVQ